MRPGSRASLLVTYGILHGLAHSHRSPARRARPVREPRQGAGRHRRRPGDGGRASSVAKPSDEVAADAVLRAEPAHPWVSRGGVKLAAALDHFASIRPGRVCLDVGASTGGFSEVLLARGARRVYAVDVGRGQLHPSLRMRPQIVSLGSDRHPQARSGAAFRAAGLRRHRRELHLARARAAGCACAGAGAGSAVGADQAADRGG